MEPSLSFYKYRQDAQIVQIPWQVLQLLPERCRLSGPNLLKKDFNADVCLKQADTGRPEGALPHLQGEGGNRGPERCLQERSAEERVESPGLEVPPRLAVRQPHIADTLLPRLQRHKEGWDDVILLGGGLGPDGGQNHEAEGQRGMAGPSGDEDGPRETRQDLRGLNT